MKTFESTGVAPNGRLYAGDLNAIQDAAAALSDFSQTVDIGTLRVGETALALTRFAAGIARITGALFVDAGIGLANLTTTQRDAIPSGGAPKGTVIFNTTTGTFQINLGTDGARSWANVGDVRQDLIDAKGDFLVGSAADTIGKFVVGTNDQTILADSAQSLGVKWGHPVLGSAQAALSGDVTMTNANQYYDGPSVSLAAGTWIVMGNVQVLNGSAGNGVGVTGKLWDGTTVVASGEVPAGNSEPGSVVLHGIVVPGSTTSYKISAASVRPGGTIKAATPDNGAGNNASSIVAVRIK